MARLTKDLTQVKGKTEQAQHHQDNTVKGVKKLDEGQTVVCYVCHKEGHKSYECKVKNGGGEKKKEKQKANKQALQHLHQQGGQESLHTLSLEEEEEWQGGGHQGEQASQQCGQMLLGAKENHFKYEEHQEGLDPEREMRSPMDYGGFGDLAKCGCIS